MSETEPERVPEPWSYSGDVWTDAECRAIVVLPPFVRTHRAGFEYELTPADGRRKAAVVDELVDHIFTIETDEPHMKVAWRVTPLRETQA